MKYREMMYKAILLEPGDEVEILVGTERDEKGVKSNKWIRGTVVKRERDYVLFQTPHYRTCVLNSDILFDHTVRKPKIRKKTKGGKAA